MTLLTGTPCQGGGWGQHYQCKLSSGILDVLQKEWLSLSWSPLTATNVPLLSSPRGAPRGPRSSTGQAGREEAATTLPDAPKATCPSHPVTHHPVCVPPDSHKAL